jgi:hypothetical protein
VRETSRDVRRLLGLVGRTRDARRARCVRRVEGRDDKRTCSTRSVSGAVPARRAFANDSCDACERRGGVRIGWRTSRRGDGSDS